MMGEGESTFCWTDNAFEGEFSIGRIPKPNEGRKERKERKEKKEGKERKRKEK